MATLDLVPQDLDLRLYVGDDPSLQFKFWTDATKTAGFDFSAYSGFAASVKAPSGAAASFTIDSTAKATGLIVLQMAGDNLRGFPANKNRWDLRVTTPTGREVTLVRGRVSLTQDVTE